MRMRTHHCCVWGCVCLVILLLYYSISCSFFSISCSTTPLTQLPEINFESKSRIYYSPNNQDFAHPVDLRKVSNKTKGPLLTLRQAYYQALSARADKDKVIVLTSTDYGFTDMALNLYYTSLRRFNISNYLYVSYDTRASRILKEHDIAHFTLTGGNSTTSNWGSSAFRKKTHIKTTIVLEALKRGFTVLILDVDIVFLKNPFPFMPCTSCDLQITSDQVEGNSGFYLVKPTKASIELHSIAARKARIHPELSNQKALDRTMEGMKRIKRIKYETLKVKEFENGESYFEDGHRMFPEDNPCKSCVIVHNNWIVSGAAKIYRFKEHLLWMVDKDGYYSNMITNYLVYDNPFDFGKKDTTAIEIEALKTAMVLGDLLNRVVILPRFHCYGCIYSACKTADKKLYTTAHCSLNTHIRITTFDKAFGTNAYRESVFLQHKLVPQRTVSSQSPKILLKSNKTMSKLSAEDAKSIKIQFTPANAMTGLSLEELDDLLRPYSHFKVLNFHSLYGIVHNEHYNSSSMYKDFALALKNGFKKADYRQY